MCEIEAKRFEIGCAGLFAVKLIILLLVNNLNDAAVD